MTTMLEKAARSAWCANPLERGPFNAVQYEYIARSVLMAVREPELRVVYVGDNLIGKSNMTFTAMIDAILNEKLEGMSDV